MRIMPRGGVARSDDQSRRRPRPVRRLTGARRGQPALTERVKHEVQDASRRRRERAAAPRRAQARVEWPRDNPPRPLPARPVTFPPYEIRKLANGMQVVLVSQNEQPVDQRADDRPRRRGARSEGQARPRDADGDAARPGRRHQRSAEQIAETIDFIGGVLGTGAGTDLSFVNAVVMKDSYEIALDLMADVVQRPTFAPEEIERQRAAGAVGVEGRRRRSGVGRRARDRSPDLRLPSLRHARRGHGGIAGRADARRLRGLPQAVLRPEQRPARRGRRHQRRRSDGRPREALRRVEAGRGAGARASPSRPTRRGA